MARQPRRVIATLARRSAPALAVALAFVLLSGGLWAESPAEARPIAEAGNPPEATLLSHERRPLPGLLTGGAPKSLEGFRALAAAGIRTFVDLRTDAEVSPETPELAEAAGLSYVRIPVGGESGLQLEAARALDRLLAEWSHYPVAVACSSGNRVGALLAVEAFWLDRMAPADALALGHAAGLTRLEPSVRLLLGLPAAEE